MLTEREIVNCMVPSEGQMQDTDRKPPTRLVTVYLQLRFTVIRWRKLTAFKGSQSPTFGAKLLWSCLPSPRAPSLRISSVNSGFCKYSCTNSWKFFIKTSSRSYCKASKQCVVTSNLSVEAKAALGYC
jgi:hypothetical protein